MLTSARKKTRRHPFEKWETEAKHTGKTFDQLWSIGFLTKFSISWICDLKVPDFPGFVVESSWSRWKMMEKLRAAQFHLPIFHDASAHYIVGEYVHPMLVCSMPMNFNTIGYYWYTIHWLSNNPRWDYVNFAGFELRLSGGCCAIAVNYRKLILVTYLNGSISNFSPAKPRIHMSFSW